MISEDLIKFMASDSRRKCSLNIFQDEGVNALNITFSFTHKDQRYGEARSLLMADIVMSKDGYVEYELEKMLDKVMWKIQGG